VTGLHGLATTECATNKPKATDEIPLKCMVFNERLVKTEKERGMKHQPKSR
jgi:hypothetical protein